MAPVRRTDYRLSVERELPGADPERPVRARLSARIVPAGGAEAPRPEELREALEGLRAELDGAAGAPPSIPRVDRPLDELVETYRPRQSELVELLHEEGELSDEEHRRLREYLASGAPPIPTSPRTTPPGPAPPPPATERPLAAAPLAQEPPSGAPRPVPELLDRYQISTLKQAGAVRARRQISFEEYMALKRHFDAGAPPPSAARGAPSQS